MSQAPDRKRLQRAMARVVAHKEKLRDQRKRLHGRASEQLDTMPHAIETANHHVARGKGGVLAYRYLRTRLTEAARLRAVAVGPEVADDG